MFYICVQNFTSLEEVIKKLQVFIFNIKHKTRSLFQEDRHGLNQKIYCTYAVTEGALQRSGPEGDMAQTPISFIFGTHYECVPLAMTCII